VDEAIADRLRRLRAPEELGNFFHESFANMRAGLDADSGKFLKEEAEQAIGEAGQVIDELYKRNLMSGANWALVKGFSGQLLQELRWNKNVEKEAKIFFPLADRMIKYDAYTPEDSREQVETTIRYHYAGDETKLIEELDKLGLTKKVE